MATGRGLNVWRMQTNIPPSITLESRCRRCLWRAALTIAAASQLAVPVAHVAWVDFPHDGLRSAAPVSESFVYGLEAASAPVAVMPMIEQDTPGVSATSSAID